MSIKKGSVHAAPHCEVRPMRRFQLRVMPVDFKWLAMVSRLLRRFQLPAMLLRIAKCARRGAAHRRVACRGAAQHCAPVSVSRLYSSVSASKDHAAFAGLVLGRHSTVKENCFSYSAAQCFCQRANAVFPVQKTRLIFARENISVKSLGISF